MKKKIYLILCAFLVLISVGCTHKQTYPRFTLKLFYYDSCSRCTAFKNSALPAIRAAFDNNFDIEYYNLDDDNGQAVYQDIVDQLIDFDQEYYGETPLVVIDEAFAILGYNGSKEDQELIKEIKRALNNEPLGNYYSMGRYQFKKGE
ncbi:hypothetical protein [Beduini massiliensis]|uniref:hypothetical protein n=1 Tax=Beduini massiliensis TaxID=1585974 RepID=UPI00059A8053|nr:hypothetical protein [Beduini massiliensis]